tara:strand:- start:64 stop:852 length:789 start_codon:yes stop_codon:yes gene_type:complete
MLNRHFYALTGSIRVLPDFIIIGAMKSGTTSLYKYMCQHPCILPAAYDEIGFFDSNFHLGINWYRSMFPRKKQMKQLSNEKGISMTGEDTPFYLWNRKVRDRIKKYLPRVKLVVILRNPVDRAFSEFNNLKRNEKLNVDFETYIKNEIQELMSESVDISKFSHPTSIISRGIYVTQLEMWYELFPKDQILVLNTTDLLNNSDIIEKSICNFLNLPKFNSKEVFYEKKASYEKMNPDTRDNLEKFYEPFNENLYKLIDKKFNW